MTDIAITLDAALKIAEIVSIIGGGGLVVYRLGRTSAKIEAAMTLQAAEISELKEDVKVVGRLLTDVAVQKERLDSHARRLDLLDRRYDELRHGEGFVYPLGARPKAEP